MKGHKGMFVVGAITFCISFIPKLVVQYHRRLVGYDPRFGFPICVKLYFV
jgi:hypothetical protein